MATGNLCQNWRYIHFSSLSWYPIQGRRWADVLGGLLHPRSPIMVRDTGKSPSQSPEALFSATRAPVPSSTLFWVRLVTQRPFLLLGSFWLVIVCISAVSLHRLMVTDPPEMSESAPPPAERVTLEVSRNSPDPLDDGGALAEGSPEPSAEGNSQRTLWGLGSLIGLCALGSWGISQRARSPRRPRVKAKGRTRRGKPKTVAKKPTGPKRLRPYSPLRDAVIVDGAQAVATPPSAAVGAPGQGQGSNPAPVRISEASNPGSPEGSDTAVHDSVVLAPEEAHPLDWSEESLAHTLDLRQRRSLSSLM